MPKKSNGVPPPKKSWCPFLYPINPKLSPLPVFGIRKIWSANEVEDMRVRNRSDRERKKHFIRPPQSSHKGYPASTSWVKTIISIVTIISIDDNFTIISRCRRGGRCLGLRKNKLKVHFALGNHAPIA